MLSYFDSSALRYCQHVTTSSPFGKKKRGDPLLLGNDAGRRRRSTRPKEIQEGLSRTIVQGRSRGNIHFQGKPNKRDLRDTCELESSWWKKMDRDGASWTSFTYEEVDVVLVFNRTVADGCVFPSLQKIRQDGDRRQGTWNRASTCPSYCVFFVSYKSFQ